MVAAVIGPHLPGESWKSKRTSTSAHGSQDSPQGTRSRDGPAGVAFQGHRDLEAQLGLGWGSGSVTGDRESRRPEHSRAAHTSPRASGHPLGSGSGSQLRFGAQAVGRRSPQALLSQSGSFLSQFHFCHPSADPAKQGTSQPFSQHLPQLTGPPHPKSSSCPFHNRVPHSTSS